jgi:flagellar basal-body rod protein FlgB
MLRELLTGTSTFDHLKRGLDATALRHSVLADNVANISRPEHSKQAVKFESEFKAQVERRLTGAQTHPAHLPVGKSPVMPEPRVVAAAQGVELESQMVDLVENTAKFSLLTRLIDGSYQGLVVAIRGRL